MVHVREPDSSMHDPTMETRCLYMPVISIHGEAGEDQFWELLLQLAIFSNPPAEDGIAPGFNRRVDPRVRNIYLELVGWAAAMRLGHQRQDARF